MRKRSSNLIRWIGVLAMLAATILGFQYATAQSSGSKINLNSPVSFPVDI